MLLLLTIYGLTFSSVGLLSLTLFPEFRRRVEAYVQSVQQSTEELENMFVVIRRQRMMLVYIGLPLIITAVAWHSLPKFLAIPVGLGIGLAMPKLIVKLVAAKRRHRFQGQLVDALMILSSSMRAGLSILQSLEVLAQEALPPMSEETALLLKEHRMGLSLEESFRRFERRMRSDELSLIITTMLVARETGGNIADVFTKLIETIRDRQKLREKIKTLTVIPRLQGWIMAAIPFVFGVFVMGINGQYFDKLRHDPVGQFVAVLAGAFWFVSLILIMWFSRSPL